MERQATLARWSGPLSLLLGLIVAVLLSRSSHLASSTALGISMQRAARDWQQIAAEPHPVGSAAHERVREYLLRSLRSLPLQVSEQRSVAAATLAGYTNAAVVNNVLARIAGSDATLPAILLAAHYDSVPGSPGAADDGVAVAALLETARVLTQAAQPRRDVLLLFTDAEELGLLGAIAFVDEHPRAHDVGVAVNFEARGTSGELLLFQTSRDSLGLLSAYRHAVQHPDAHSLFSTLARLLPNDTDVTAFAWRIPLVLGFAFAEGLEHYHGATDDLAHVDPACLERVTITAVELARSFANLEQLPRTHRAALYFSLFGRWLVSYPAWVARVTSVALALIWFGLVRRGVRAARWGWRDLRRGAVWVGWAWLVAMGLAIVSEVLVGRHVDARTWAALAPSLGVATLLIAAGAQLLLLGRACAQCNVEALGLGAIGAQLLIVVALGWFAPEASALWHYAVGLALVGWLWPLDGQAFATGWRASSSAIAGFFAVLLVAPVMAMAFRIAGPGFVALPITLSALLLTLALPSWFAVGRDWLRSLAGMTIVLGMCLWVRSFVARDEHVSNDAYVPTTAVSARGTIRLEAAATPMSAPWGASVIAGPKPNQFEVEIQAADTRCVHLSELQTARVRALGVNGRSVHPIVHFTPKLDERLFRLIAGDHSNRGFRFSFCGASNESLRLSLEVAGSEPAELAWAEELPSPLQSR